MNAMTWEPVAIVVGFWLAAGMTVANILYRRGHDGWRWMVVCALAGPLALLLVVDQVRFVEAEAEAEAEARPVGLGPATPARARGDRHHPGRSAPAHRFARRRALAPHSHRKEHRVQG